MTDEAADLLISGAEKMGITLSEKQKDDFSKLCDELIEWNSHINLTAVREPVEIAQKHFLDSLSLAGLCGLKGTGKLIDVGCGAGFPGLPLKIIYPDLNVTFLDATKKKLDFIRNIIEIIPLDHTQCIHARAEEAGQKAECREKFDFATARAVAELRILAEICLPFVKTGGYFFAMKGPDAAEELTNAKHAITELGAEVVDVKQFTLPESDLGRTVIVLEKRRQMPDRYPRANAKIEKRPL